MKFHDTVIITKGLCYLLVGAFTPWAAALAQWANEGTWPPKIIWMGVILPASIIGAANSMLSFLSGSFTNYQAKRQNGDTQIMVKQ